MTFEEARDVFLHHLDKIKFACDSKTASDAEKWAEATVIISEYLRRNPNEDCVSRQAVGALISNYIVKIISEGGRDLNAHTNEVLRQILNNICSVDALPPIRPQMKKGHWIDITNKNETVIALRCSCCKESPKHAIRSAFCPNCGADMSEGSNEE